MKRWQHLVFAFVVFLGISLFIFYDVKKEAIKTQEKEQSELAFNFSWDETKTLQITTEKTVVSFASDFTKVVAQDPPSPVPIEKIAPETWNWWIDAPFRTDAEIDDVHNYFRAFKSLKVTKVVAENVDDLGRYGLDPEKDGILEIRLEDKKGKVATLTIGKFNPDKTGNYAIASHQKKILLIEQRLNYLRNKNLDHFRRKNLLEYDNNSVDRIEYTWEGKPDMVLVKRELKWRLEKPFAAQGDNIKVSSFLSDVKNLRAVYFPSENADAEAAEYGFVQPRGQVRLYLNADTDKEQIATLIVGGDTDDKAGFYLRKAGAQSVFQVKKFNFNKLTKNLNDFVDHHLAADIENDISTIRFSGRFTGADKAAVATVLKDPQGRWLVEKDGLVFHADSSKVDELEQKILDLKAEEYVGREPQGKHGFDQPVVVLEVVEKKRQDPWRFVFAETVQKKSESAKETKQYFVRGGPDNLVFRARESVVADFTTSPDEVRSKRPVPLGFDISDITINVENGLLEIKQQNESWQATKADGLERLEGDRLNQLVEKIREMSFTFKKDHKVLQEVESGPSMHFVVNTVRAPEEGKEPLKTPFDFVVFVKPLKKEALPREFVGEGYLLVAKKQQHVSEYRGVVKKATFDRIKTLLGQPTEIVEKENKK